MENNFSLWPDELYSLLKVHNISQVSVVPDAGLSDVFAQHHPDLDFIDRG